MNSSFVRRIADLAVAMTLFLGTTKALSAGSSLIEVSVGGKKHAGRLEAKGPGVCWLMGRDGRLAPYEIDDIKSLRTAAPRFQSLSISELRDELRKEFGKPFRIDGTGHFLICAEKNGRKYGDICEDTYRMFQRYFSVRGFKIMEPEFPLVAIVFPTQSEFTAYCRKDHVSPASGMLGYYSSLSNRIALFDRDDTPQASTSGSADTESIATIFGRREPPTLAARNSVFARLNTGVAANLHDTTIHEVTHQVAFNAGLHSRLGDTPKWIIEGLATMFEAPGIRDSHHGASAKQRINRGRYVDFMQYRSARRKPGSLEQFIRSDALYTSAPLDGYAEGWALTFFLAETRHGSYSRYLKTVAHRDQSKACSPEERVAAFRTAFGELRSLEADYLRFFDGLK